MGSKTRFYADVMALHPGVTGSCNLVTVRFPTGKRMAFIVDCGLFQEKEYSNYNLSFPFNAMNIEFALVTHNHVDHIGRLPLLQKNGFNGKVYMTSVTKVLCRYALADSYRVLKESAKHSKTKELYSAADVANIQNNIVGCEYEETVYINKFVKATFFINGHLLGAAAILVQISYPDEKDINLLFTGDYSPKNMFFNVPMLPEWVHNMDLTVVQEATYGDMDSSEVVNTFEKNVCNKINHGGSVLCPVFSLGRAQEILYMLKEMQDKGKLSKDVVIYFDGKLAQKYTRVYLTDNIGIREDMREFLPDNLISVDRAIRDTVFESHEQKIVVTTSGMGTYGPAQLYIPKFIQRENWLIQFTGYTAEGTLGSKLKNTTIGEDVEIGGVIYRKKADVEYTTEFSAHAKADEMLDFLAKFNNLKLVLVNHGEPNTKLKFAKRIVDEVNPKNVAILGREYFYRIDHYGLIKSMTTKFD